MRIPCGLLALLLYLSPAFSSFAAQAVVTAPGDAPQLFDGRVTGYETVDYEVTGEAAEILNVDLQSANGAAYFNILPSGTEEAIFVGANKGNVASVPLPAAGSYRIRVYLIRAAARREETARYTLAIGLGPPDFADGLAGGPDYWMVRGLVAGALNVREGPATRYPVIGILRNGNVLENRGCRLTGTERWCRVRATGSGVAGWVAGRYLAESPPPRRPEVPPGGPVGNGTPFDATGYVACATPAGEPQRQCPFGVVRAGPGNAGVWIARGDGTELHVLFESGVVVAVSPATAWQVQQDGDRYVITADNARYEIIAAVVHGG